MAEPSTIDDRFDSTALTLPCWIALALAAAGIAFGVGHRADGPGWGQVAGITLAIAGLLVIGMCIARTPRNTLVLLVAAATALLAYASTYREWDSAQLLFLVMAGVAFTAAVIQLLPQAVRRAAVSFIVVFHFLGVLSAITSPQPQTWLSNWMWVTYFRPHLVFCYTNNAYQFYSPDPGPASLLWFCVEYQDGSKSWFKSPRKPETHLDPMSVEFYRRLSMVEAVNQNAQLAFVPQEVLLSRQQMIPEIPFADLPQSQQYFVPQPLARRTLGSYVRHVAHVHGGPDVVKSIRAYRVLHRMLEARQFAAGHNPFGESTYMPFYMGQYDTEGTLTNPSDPMLYWLIPIVRKPTTVTPMPRKSIESVDNYLARHAGIDPFEDRNGVAP